MDYSDTIELIQFNEYTTKASGFGRSATASCHAATPTC